MKDEDDPVESPHDHDNASNDDSKRWWSTIYSIDRKGPHAAEEEAQAGAFFDLYADAHLWVINELPNWDNDEESRVGGKVRGNQDQQFKLVFNVVKQDDGRLVNSNLLNGTDHYDKIIDQARKELSDDD